MKTSLFFITLAIMTSCTQAQNVTKLSVADFEQKLAGTGSKTLLDVRTPGEYNSGHLKDAVMIDFYSNDFKTQVSKLDKSKPVFVYCASGVRSGAAAKRLADMGFTQIFDLRGGMNAWRSEKKPTVK